MTDVSFEQFPRVFAEKEKLHPLRVPQDQVVNSALLEFKNQPGLEAGTVEKFVKEHVRVVSIGNVDVTIIDQEHDEHKGMIDPVLQAYLDNPRTRTAVVEYFMPELQRNSPQLPDVIKKALGSIDDVNKEGRGSFFMDIAEIMKKQGKTVSLVDIANKLDYEAYYALMKAQALPMLTSLIPGLPYSPLDRLLLASALPLVSWGVDEFLETGGKGIYDKQKLSKLENFYLSMEDGRRVYAAKGLEQMAKDYNKEYPSSDEQKRSQIVVVYPRAHATRIANYMTDQSLFTKAAKTAKQYLYHLPNLDYSYRTYTWKDMLAQATGKPDLASWQLTTSKKF